MNRYIKAMEIGLANEDEGITYNDLVKELEVFYGRKMTIHAESTFYYWFVDNFSATNEALKNQSGWKSYFLHYYYFKNNIKKRESNLTKSGVDLFKQLDNIKWFLNGQAAKQYLDYVELTDARKQAKQTSYFSIISILIAVTAIGIGIFQNNDNPQPPYDVKIIEDNTKVKELQKENDNLREELHKAEMMVRVLEASEQPSK
jgi:hypothetical protein